MERPGWIDVLVASFVPGALLGAQITGLLFFLNTELPFAPGPLLRGLVIYGGLLGLLGVVVHLPFLWSRPGRARRVFPWELTAVLAVSALLAWAHASIYAFYLPPGINVRLIKTGVWLSVAALVAFYTVLLHSLGHRPYGRRSRIALGFLALFSLYIVIERREAFQPAAAPSPLSSTSEPGDRRELWVVGLEGATLEAILPMAEEGELPFFSRMLREGAWARLKSLAPNHRLSLWTTLASGKYPFRHGVLGEATYTADYLSPGGRLQLLPRGVGFAWWGLLGARKQPAPTGGRVLRLWELLPRLGISSGVLGWPGCSDRLVSRPGASDGGPRSGRRAVPVFTVGEGFFAEHQDASAVEPAELAARARLFRMRGDEIDPAELNAFGPNPPPVVVDALAQDLWRESLFLFLLGQDRDVEAGFLHLPGLGRVSRAYFGGYARAEFEGAQHRDYLSASELLSRYYSHLDAFLAELWARRSDGALLVVVSAFGTSEPQGWRKWATELAGGRPLDGYTEGSPDGVLFLLGAGIDGGSRLTGADLVDVVPTVVYGLGLPIARDMDGQILTGAFERGFLARHPLTFVPSYETIRAGSR